LKSQKTDGALGTPRLQSFGVGEAEIVLGFSFQTATAAGANWSRSHFISVNRMLLVLEGQKVTASTFGDAPAGERG
jgi:hypothetical protein